MFALFARTLALAYYYFARHVHDATWRSFRDRCRRETQLPDSEREIDPTFQFEEPPKTD